MKNNTPTDKKCIFCDIAKRSGTEIIDIEPLNPVVKGHRIVFSAHHSSDFTDDVGITMRVVQYASELAKKIGGEYNLITSKGKNATQSIFHLHVHLVPRKENDGLPLPWTSQVSSTEKCKCPCHDNVLRQSFRHNTKCCDEMDGEVNVNLGVGRTDENGLYHPDEITKNLVSFITRLLQASKKETIQKEYRRTIDEICSAMVVFFKENYDKKHISLESWGAIEDFIDSFSQMLLAVPKGK